MQAYTIFYNIFLDYNFAISHILCIFAPVMEENIVNQSAKEMQAEAFRQKADHYIVCFVDTCPLREECLRWIVGNHVDAELAALSSVNPRNPKHGDEHCSMYRKSQRVMMKRGLTQMYHEMPHYKETQIRNALIQLWGRRKYFEMRRGDRLITPSQQQDIVDTCRHFGWDGPIVYDAEQEDWLW